MNAVGSQGLVGVKSWQLISDSIFNPLLVVLFPEPSLLRTEV